jgi:hypothetical protein
MRHPSGAYTLNPRFRKFPTGAPRPYVALCARCLSRKPSLRPTFTAIQKALRSMLYSVSLAADVTASTDGTTGSHSEEEEDIATITEGQESRAATTPAATSSAEGSRRSGTSYRDIAAAAAAAEAAANASGGASPRDPAAAAAAAAAAALSARTPRKQQQQRQSRIPRQPATLPLAGTTASADQPLAHGSVASSSTATDVPSATTTTTNTATANPLAPNPHGSRASSNHSSQVPLLARDGSSDLPLLPGPPSSLSLASSPHTDSIGTTPPPPPPAIMNSALQAGSPPAEPAPALPAAAAMLLPTGNPADNGYVPLDEDVENGVMAVASKALEAGVVSEGCIGVAAPGIPSSSNGAASFVTVVAGGDMALLEGSSGSTAGEGEAVSAQLRVAHGSRPSQAGSVAAGVQQRAGGATEGADSDSPPRKSS